MSHEISLETAIEYMESQVGEIGAVLGVVLYSQDILDYLKELKELKDSSHAEKTLVNYHEDQRDSYYECSNCHNVINRLQKFCDKCGKRLSWDMERMGKC